MTKSQNQEHQWDEKHDLLMSKQFPHGKDEAEGKLVLVPQSVVCIEAFSYLGKLLFEPGHVRKHLISFFLSAFFGNEMCCLCDHLVLSIHHRNPLLNILHESVQQLN